ncbi:general stress protein CsbD [Micromonospora deserti]|uniref:General stress protein CsbD n=1 Tax=Micromonospora deserti TaxID=2070366 RepID=A0A2W2BVS9_9ACTN|nr:general stress protein CsbD [Micromonospora deserti]PZF84524.1 general stress protein CsbD [Micromonospora deserti]
MSFERANDRVEKVAGPARARMGDMSQNERSQAEQVMRRDEVRGNQPGEHVQEDARDARDTFTS